MKTFVRCFAACLLACLASHGALAAEVFKDDFSTDTVADWTVYDQGLAGGPSRWKVEDGALHQPTNIYHVPIQRVSDRPLKEWLGTIAVAGDPDWSDYRFEFDFSTQDNDGIGCVFRFTDTGNYYHFQVDAESRFFQVTKKLNGAFYVLASGEAGYKVAEWNHVAVRLAGKNLQVALNGKLLASVEDPHLKTGKIGLETRGCDRSKFDNVAVDDDPGSDIGETDTPGDIVFADEFDTDSIAQWTVFDIGKNEAPSDWNIKDGAVHQTSNIYTRLQNSQHPEWDWTGSFLVAKGLAFTDGIIETEFSSTDDDGIGLTWRFKDPGNYYKVQFDTSSKFWQISKTVDGEFTCLAWGRDKTYTKGKKHHLRVQAQGTTMAVYLDAELVGVIEDTSIVSGSAGFETRGNSGSHFDYLRVIEPDEPMDVGAIEGTLMKQAVGSIQLSKLAYLPGDEMVLEIPQAARVRADAFRLEVKDPSGAVLSQKRIDAGAESVTVWRNDGAAPGVYRLDINSDTTTLRTIPFNVWNSVPTDVGVCAHRGDNAVAPENTVPAFESAVRKGAHQIELDVYTSKDGKLVIIHDGKVDRTTNGTGRVIDLTFDELRALDAGSWKGEQFKGTKIPTFREALQAIPAYIQLNCHLKSGKGLAADVTREIVEMGRLDQCFLACSVGQAAEARAVEPAIRICNMSGQQGPQTDYPERTIKMGAEYIQILGWHDCMPEACAKLREAGVGINYFGTSDPVFFRRLLEAGVQYPLVDNLDAVIPVLRELGVSMAGEGG